MSTISVITYNGPNEISGAPILLAEEPLLPHRSLWPRCMSVGTACSHLEGRRHGLRFARIVQTILLCLELHWMENELPSNEAPASDSSPASDSAPASD